MKFFVFVFYPPKGAFFPRGGQGSLFVCFFWWGGGTTAREGGVFQVGKISPGGGARGARFFGLNPFHQLVETGRALGSILVFLPVGLIRGGPNSVFFPLRGRGPGLFGNKGKI